MITRRTVMRVSCTAGAGMVLGRTPLVFGRDVLIDDRLLAFHGPNTSPIHDPGAPEHAFNDAEFRMRAQLEPCTIIVQHGSAFVHELLKLECQVVENVAMFVSDVQEVAGLRREQVLSILSGDVRDWKDVGGQGGPINIYHNAESIKIAGFYAFLRTYGVESGFQTRVDPSRIRSAAGYEALCMAAKSDPNALVIGLRRCLDPSLRLLAIDSVFPHEADTRTSYPLWMAAAISVRIKGYEKHYLEYKNYLDHVLAEYKHEEELMRSLFS